MRNKLVLCLGSNVDCEINMERAEVLLAQYFDRICFSGPIYTEPVALLGSTLFLNQTAVAFTSVSLEEVGRVLKEMELQLGRTPESKRTGRIPIDIDLLQWNDQVLKPDDLKREYVRLLLFRLSSAMEENERREHETDWSCCHDNEVKQGADNTF